MINELDKYKFNDESIKLNSRINDMIEIYYPQGIDASLYFHVMISHVALTIYEAHLNEEIIDELSSHLKNAHEYFKETCKND